MKDNAFDMFDQYDMENKRILPFKKRWLFLVLFVIVIVVAVITIIRIYPRNDRIETENLPVSYIINNENNYYSFQRRGDCAGYASAYVLRHTGIDADGAKVYDEMPMFFGVAAMHNVINKLGNYGLGAKAYYGNIDTLKAQLNKGMPVIVLIKIIIGNENGLHYAVVVGYDEDYIYMADSTESKTNVFDNKQYNRKVSYKEFMDLWKTNVYPFVNNCYIVVE